VRDKFGAGIVARGSCPGIQTLKISKKINRRKKTRCCICYWGKDHVAEADKSNDLCHGTTDNPSKGRKGAQNRIK